ncbi:MAG: sigma-70 family RNA polymerase sigma factor [Sciscionella sp.]
MADTWSSPASREPADTTAKRRATDTRSRADAELVVRVSRGDRLAFAELYDKYSKPAFSLARRICVAQELAEEVVQEAFVRLWKDPSNFDRNKGSFATWLLTLVHHRAVDAVRREDAQRRRAAAVAPLEAGAHSNVPSAADDALALVVNGQVRDALHHLPEDQRRVIALAYFGGYTQNEVAALIGVPLGTVKSRTFAGLRRLRTLLASLTMSDSLGFFDGGADGTAMGVTR